MKTSIATLTLVLAVLFLSNLSFGQCGTGCFFIDNQTSCDWRYIVYGNNINCNGTSTVAQSGTVLANSCVPVNSTYCSSFSLMLEKIEIYSGTTLVGTFGNSATCGHNNTDSWNCSACSCTVAGDWELTASNYATIKQ